MENTRLYIVRADTLKPGDTFFDILEGGGHMWQRTATSDPDNRVQAMNLSNFGVVFFGEAQLIAAISDPG